MKVIKFNSVKKIFTWEWTVVGVDRNGVKHQLTGVSHSYQDVMNALRDAERTPDICWALCSWVGEDKVP